MPVVTLLGLVGNTLAILVLHSPGVDMKVLDSQGGNMVQVALKHLDSNNRNVEARLRMISKHPTIKTLLNVRNQKGDTPAIQLLKKKKFSLVNILLDSPDLDLDVEDSRGRNLETIAR